MRQYYYYAIIIIIVTYERGSAAFNSCGPKFQWAPPRAPRYPYMTFLNDAICPSWTTRHHITKDPRNNANLVLPRGVPFAFACGACFQTSKLKANLTLRADQVQAEFQALSGSNGIIHQHSAYMDCLISYGVTSPVSRYGSLECRLNRGKRLTTETVKFSVRKVDIQEGPLRQILITRKSEKALLQCPDTTLTNLKNIVYVWHSYLETNQILQQNKPEIIIASLRKNVTFTPTKEVQRLSCSTFDIFNPRKVWRTNYEIVDERRKEVKKEDKITKGEWSLDGNLLQDKRPTKSSTLFQPIIWIVGAAGIIIILGVLVSMGLCKCPFAKSALPETLVCPTENKNNLLFVGGIDNQQVSS